MNFKKRELGALATGITLAIASMSAQAADQPILTVEGGQSSAVITGGGTINDGASFLTTVPAADALDIVATISPPSGDVGQTGSLIAVVRADGIGDFVRLPDGSFELFDLAAPQTFATKTLTATESFSVLEGIVGSDIGVTDVTLDVYVGYWVGDDFGGITYNANPISVTIDEVPQDGCPTNTTAGQGKFADKPVCILSSAERITTNTHLTANNSYLIDGTVFIGENVDTPNDDKISLTIDAGTTLVAPEGVNTLVIDRSAKIYANGTAANPIIMTSEQDVAGVDALNLRGTWGGLVINGSATLNTQSGTDEGEGSTGTYGGGSSPRDDDDSGSVTYVQIKYAGWPITSENELNSISLQGVGSGTILDYIQVHNGADDGIEFYGGTVNAKHLVLTGNDDDALDWTTGYRGNLQHIVVKQTSSGDNCIEADNLGSNPIATPRSIPTVSNLTCIGSPDQKGNGHAFELKAGTGMNMSNSIIGGTFPPVDEGCILIKGEETFTQSGASIAELNGTLTMENSLITSECAADLQESGDAPWTTANWYGAQANSSFGTVDLGVAPNPFVGASDWTNGPIINAIPANIPSADFFDDVDYIGAIKDAASDWTSGWTFTDF